MNFQVAYCTDVGVRKNVNQDSLYVKQIKIKDQNILLAVICDGMGGLSQGELASATVVRDFDKWFIEEFVVAYEDKQIDIIKEEWITLLNKSNKKILNYGKSNGIQMGTTATAVLLFDDGHYLIIHIGDTRVYFVNSVRICQVTEDHTYVAKEVKLGHMTKDEAEQDSRRNVLLQCVGAMEVLQPTMYEGVVERNSYLLLCSDGFRHKYTEEEIYKGLSENIKQMNVDNMYSFLRVATDRCIQRGENDNISSVLIKVS